MSSYDEPTQQVRRPQPPPAPLPGSLDPLRDRPSETAGVETAGVETGTGWVDTHPTVEETPPAAPVEAPPTGVLPLDQIFESPEPARTPTVTTDAPTWTAMPVVPVRSEPVTAAGPRTSGTWSTPYDGTSEPRASRKGMDLDGARLQVQSWLRRDDNGLMLLTALVACVLMIVVAGVGN